MLVREWMVKEVITVTLDTSVLKASKMLKDHNIRRLPVVNANNMIIGIVSDRDIKDASPSKATTLDMHELHYLLSELKISDVMTEAPVTIKPTDTVETAALLMEEKGFGSLPVVDEENKIVGIITDNDLFKIYVEVTGSRYGGMQLCLKLEDVPGSTIPLLDMLHAHGANLVTLLSAEVPGEKNMRKLYVHLRPMDRSEGNKLIEDIKANFNLRYWVREKVYEAE